MQLLILCPGNIAKSVHEISCFTDVLSYYLPRSLQTLTGLTVDIKSMPSTDGPELQKFFSTVEVKQYDAILTLGLRFYSKISEHTTGILRNRFTGLICQVHDGSRLDRDPVDITFTFKNDDARMATNKNWYNRHKKFNACMGWATDPEINFPSQSTTNLRILVDHTNYGENPIDETENILRDIKKFVESESWKLRYDSVSVRRFDTGQVIDVDFNDLTVHRYDRSIPIPFSKITKEHCEAHVFCVTHPESVGMVVLETAMAGALVVVPRGFIAQDRLDTVRHIEWSGTIDWAQVLDNIDIESSRKVALANTWDMVAKRIYITLQMKLSTGTLG